MASGNLTLAPDEMAENEVDRLLAIVAQIQEVCEHDFKLCEPLTLQGSKVPGVFVGSIAGHWESLSAAPAMHLRCSKCSMKKTVSVIQTCPRCLNEMQAGRCLGAESRERYFGEEYLYYAIRLHFCPNCSFKVASDVWDQ